MKSLFDEYTFFDYKFPEPQYLGAKYNLLPWINKFVPSGISTALDAFSGSQSVGFLFKQLGFKVISNDFLSFNNQIGKALIENKQYTLNKEDINLLFSESPRKVMFSLAFSLKKKMLNLLITLEQTSFYYPILTNKLLLLPL